VSADIGLYFFLRSILLSLGMLPQETFINPVASVLLMVLEKLGSSLRDTLQKVTNALFVDEKLVNELVKDIQKALLQADVNVKLVFELSKRIKERALKEEAPGSIGKKDWLVKIVYDELVKFLGEEQKAIAIDPKKKPFVLMMVGLFGAGKTTSIGKISKFYSKRGYKIAALGLDVHRPAASEQLEQVCKSVGVQSFVNKKEKDPLKIIKEFEKNFPKYDVLIVDTAGRDALSEDLIEELRKVDKKLSPDEKLLVMAADIGQAAQQQAQAFHDTVNITGVVITKLDGTAKGGGALSACAITGAKIVFVGVGEKPEDLEEFKPKNFVGRLLGLGDIEALLEKAKDAMTEDEAQDLGKKLLKGEFNLIDLYEQMQAMKKMGSFSKLLEMVPGMGQLKLPKELLNVQEGKLERWKHIMNSMTKKELEDPELISGSRIERIAKGSGTNPGNVKDLIKQYRQGKKMMKMMKGGKGMDQMMKKIGSMKGMMG